MSESSTDHFLHDPSQPAAVEVVTMLGDSIVEVEHVRAASAQVKGGSWRLPAALAAFAALVSLAAFVIGVASAGRDASARAAWRASDRPLHEFRPERLSRGWDVAAFGGLALAIGAAGAAVARRRSRKDADASLPDRMTAHGRALAEGYALYREPTGAAGVLVSAGAGAVLAERSGASMPAPEEVAFARLAAGALLEISAGPRRTLIRATSATRAGMVTSSHALDRRALVFVGGSLAAHLVLLALLRTIPPDSQTLALDAGSNEARLTHVEMRAAEDDLVEPSADSGDGAAQGAAAAASPGAEGEAGTTETTAKARAAIAKRSETPTLSREQARAEAREAGFLGAWQNKSDPFSSFASSSEFSSGWDDFDAQGNLDGDTLGAGAGNFGTGKIGFGPGGNGPLGGTIGTGRFSTGTCYSSHCSEMGGGGGGGPVQRRTSKAPETVKIGDAETDGELDASIIRRYIRRKLAQIQYCYERELLTQPNLGGTVNVSFLINNSGSVVAPRASGVTAGLASCVGDVIATVQFPAPKGGGSVRVKYPFTFRQSGS